MIKTAFHIESASPGAILREEKLAGTKLGIEAAAFTSAGLLAPDELVVEIVGKWLSTKNGSFLFDGFPRSIGQATALDEMLKLDKRVQVAVFLDAQPDTIRNRVERRLVCTACREVVAIGWQVSGEDSPCPRCNAALSRRPDDNAESLAVRMREFDQKNSRVLDHYRQSGVLEVIPAGQSPDAVFRAFSNVLTRA